MFCFKKSKYQLFVATILLTCFLVSFVPAATAKLFDGPVDKLPVLERVALRNGEVVLAGEKGEYLARILIEGSVDEVWQVLTDYENFEQFLPGVASSELLENNGDRKVTEQVNQVNTFIFSTEARVRLVVTESYPQKIYFDFVDGDLASLKGNWLLEPVSKTSSTPPNRVLVTHRVAVQPNNNAGKSFFYGIYENTLTETLAAIKQEAETRNFLVDRS